MAYSTFANLSRIRTSSINLVINGQNGWYHIQGNEYLMAKMVGITYKEMNIFIYYFVIPFSWCFLLDVRLIGYITIPLQTEEQFRYDGAGR